MTLCFALLLVASDLPLSLGDEILESRTTDNDLMFARLRGGLLFSRRLQFDAITVSGAELHSKQKISGSAGMDLGLSFEIENKNSTSLDFILFASIEGAFGSEFLIEDANLCFGLRSRAEPGSVSPWAPQEFAIYFGPSYGLLQARDSGFVDFKGGAGSRTGLSLAWKVGRALGIGLTVEYRYLKFDVKDKSEIASGDTSTTAGGVWAGVGVDFRF
jgi:hypothetical protein